MSDEKVVDESKTRRIALSIPPKMYMELLLKIRHENLNWKRFFRFLIEGFIEDDPRVMEYLDLRMSEIRAKNRTKKLDKERKMVQNTIDVFGLNEEEIQDIYNIIEEEVEP